MTKKEIPSNYDRQVDIGRQIFLEYDQQLLICKFNLESDENWIYLTYLHTPCRISRATGQIDELLMGSWSECRNYGTVMTIYDLLCHHKGTTAPALHHTWCTAASFVITGVQDTGMFSGKYATFFDGHPEALKAACIKLGGICQKPMSGADLTCLFPVTAFFPVLLQFWQADEDFPPQLLLMWDSNAMQYLHYETTFYLQGDLLERLKKIMEA